MAGPLVVALTVRWVASGMALIVSCSRFARVSTWTTPPSTKPAEVATTSQGGPLTVAPVGIVPGAPDSWKMLALRLPGLRTARWAMNESFGLLGPATFQTEVQAAVLAALMLGPEEKHSATLEPLATLSPSSSTPVVMLDALVVEALKVAKVPLPRTKVLTTARTIRPTRTCLARLMAPVRSPAGLWV